MADERKLNIAPIRNIRQAQQDLNAAARDLAEWLVSTGAQLAEEEHTLIEAVHDFDEAERKRRTFAEASNGA